MSAEAKYDLQIRVTRGLSPAEGQVKLKQISDCIPKLDPVVQAAAAKVNLADPQSVAALAQVTPGFAKIEVPGATIHENPFPVWLYEALMQLIPDLKFDDINYTLFRRCDHRDDAQHYKEWLENEFLKSDFVQSDPVKQAVAAKVSVVVTMWLPELFQDIDGY